MHTFHIPQACSGLFFARYTESFQKCENRKPMMACSSSFLYIGMASHYHTHSFRHTQALTHTIAYGKHITKITPPAIWGILVCEDQGERELKGGTVWSPLNIPAQKKKACCGIGWCSSQWISLYIIKHSSSTTYASKKRAVIVLKCILMWVTLRIKTHFNEYWKFLSFMTHHKKSSNKNIFQLAEVIQCILMEVISYK